MYERGIEFLKEVAESQDFDDRLQVLNGNTIYDQKIKKSVDKIFRVEKELKKLYPKDLVEKVENYID